MIYDTLDPVRNGHGSNMAALAEQIDNGSVIVPALEMFQGKLSCFRAPQPAPEQYGKNGTIPLPIRLLGLGNGASLWLVLR